MFNIFKKTEPVKTVIIKNPSDIISEKTNTLQNGLRIAITALEKDIVNYQWNNGGQCNCGVVVQALTGHTKEFVGDLYRQAIRDADMQGKTTWRQIAQNSCSITGIPMKDVFKSLEKYGLTVSDIVHLENMSNEAILQLSGIDTAEKNYFTKRENLVKYLQSWLKIIEGKTNDFKFTDKSELEAKLLIATNKENYEEAAKLRDLILEM